MNKKKILWHSNSQTAKTGYGVQTKLFCSRLKDDYDVVVSAFYGRQGSAAEVNGILELPVIEDLYGNDTVSVYYDYHKADCVVSLIDPFVCDPTVWGKLNWIAWVPIDREGVDVQTQVALSVAKEVWAMSRFGQEQLRKIGINAKYVPHAVDTSIFKPIDRETAREEFANWIGKTYEDLENTKIVITNAANKGRPSRKNFSGLFAAFKIFLQKNPDSLLYVHSFPSSQIGEDLLALALEYGIEDYVFFPTGLSFFTGNLSDEKLNVFYNAADVFVLLSHGEGFGIPIIEAQAAGCPVVVSDFSAMSELVPDFSKVKVTKTRAWLGGTGGEWCVPDIHDAVEKMQYVVDNPALREEAVEYGAKYDIDVVYDIMLSNLDHFLENVEVSKKMRMPRIHSRPEISIVLTTYNNQDTVERALNSIIEKNNNVKYQLIVVDDCSSDNTRDILERYRDKIDNLIFLDRGVGQAEALNTGLEYLIGTYVMKLDGDDYLEEGCLRVAVDFLNKHPECGLIYGETKDFGNRDRVVRPTTFRLSEFLSGGQPYGEVIYRSEAHLVHGLKYRAAVTDEERPYGLVDFDFVLQLVLSLNWIALPINQRILYYNVRDGSISSRTNNNITKVKQNIRQMWPGVKIK